jgi:hypothetical protein
VDYLGIESRMKSFQTKEFRVLIVVLIGVWKNGDAMAYICILTQHITWLYRTPITFFTYKIRLCITVHFLYLLI